MTKLGREIRVKFIYTDELLRKILNNPTKEHLYDMRDKFAKKETIKFNPFDKPAFEKELLTFSNTFKFFTYKDIVETLKDYKEFTILEYRITDNNEDAFNRKEYGRCWACDISGIVIDGNKYRIRTVTTSPAVVQGDYMNLNKDCPSLKSTRRNINHHSIT